MQKIVFVFSTLIYIEAFVERNSVNFLQNFCLNMYSVRGENFRGKFHADKSRIQALGNIPIISDSIFFTQSDNVHAYA